MDVFRVSPRVRLSTPWFPVRDPRSGRPGTHLGRGGEGATFGRVPAEMTDEGSKERTFYPFTTMGRPASLYLVLVPYSKVGGHSSVLRHSTLRRSGPYSK